jgi:hypothetical protein
MALTTSLSAVQLTRVSKFSQNRELVNP